jgi:phage repressor protein C with HTH and peptisase S24 domain
MSEPFERLQAARKQAGYDSKTAAALAMGVSVPGYIHHENGTRNLAGAAQRYASFFRVNLEWLLTGKGDMRGHLRVPMMGAVGAGARIENWAVDGDIDHRYDIDLPDLTHAGALRVTGDSQWPKWIEGDLILFDTRPRRPQDLANRYCVVETADGVRLIKMLRRSSRPGLWRLESHNAAPEEVEMQAVYLYLMTLAG